MNILGISGFENAVAFKKAHWPGLDEREYRISQGHDSAAVLISDGVVVAAAAEERFNRQKHSAKFPARAICYCLREAGFSLADIDEIAHGFDYAPCKKAFSLDPETAELYDQVFSRDSLLASLNRDCPGFPPERVHHVNHHLAHAASAYFTSGWKECLAIVIDGMGETQSVSIFHAHEGKLDKLHEISAYDSIGVFYSLITLHLGFDFNSDEYKIMGLAPYGDPARYREFFRQTVKLLPDGSIHIPALRWNRSRDDRELYLETRKHIERNLGNSRHPADEIADQHRDIAAALQERLDQVMLHICGNFGKRTGLRNLALSGGVALNCTANGALLKSGIFDDIYVQPAAGDDGSALGAALYRASRTGGIRNFRLPTPFLGPACSMDEVEAALAEFAPSIEVARHSSLEMTCEEAARMIAEGAVIAWYRGRMEFGPRALGHRSILADPSRPDMRDRINAMIKMREAFRPFAPAVTLEQVHLWFDVPPATSLPYMIVTVDVREPYRAQLPAVTHVNGSARVQTVSRADNPEFHTLLEVVGKTTGREMVLNTSFNIKGQPIVNTPREAIYTFLGTGIDFLFLENTLVRRRYPLNRGTRENFDEVFLREREPVLKR